MMPCRNRTLPALTVALGLVAACGGPYGPDEVAADTLCLTVEGLEHCIDTPDLDVTRDGDSIVRLAGRTTFPGAELGYETVDLDLTIDLSTDPPTLSGQALPALLTCSVDIAHGDHCHLGIPSDRACALPVGTADVSRVRVGDSDSGELALRFTATSPIDAPDCCAHTCAESTRPLTSEPPGPYRIHGALRVGLPAPDGPV